MRKPWIPRAMLVAPKLDPRPGPCRIRRRHALLINPFYPKDPHASFGKHVLTPTLALTSIAASTPENWQVRYWDENLLQGPPPWQPFPQVVGISVHLTFADRAYELARWYRQRGAIVVLGGILVPRRSFLTTTSLIATRGCRNRCGFCYLSTGELHMPYQMRDVEQVADEFRRGNQPYGVFTDNNLGSKPEYLRSLCQALRPLEKIWSAAVSLDVADDPTLVREMALAGCTGVFVGFESLEHENLVDARKKTPRPDDFARRVELFHRNGIQVNASFVLGFDHDGPDTFQRTVDWIEKNRLECATFHILTPYPGTPLFRRMEAEGRLLHKDWRFYDTAHVVFRPRNLTPQQLSAGYCWCYRRLFSHRSIWRRRPRDARSVLPYLAMSYLYKRSNLAWHLLIKYRLTATVWRPLVELSRQRHLRFRRALEAREVDHERQPGVVVSAGL